MPPAPDRPGVYFAFTHKITNQMPDEKLPEGYDDLTGRKENR
jgi:hypothetical protein